MRCARRPPSAEDAVALFAVRLRIMCGDDPNPLCCAVLVDDYDSELGVTAALLSEPSNETERLQAIPSAELAVEYLAVRWGTVAGCAIEPISGLSSNCGCLRLSPPSDPRDCRRTSALPCTSALNVHQ
jgi:hypothetical protein